ncbi:hypothetical protein ASE23_27205 [Rhizobium sp. Root73]|uniref:retron system putative HNH endonuclease n=1 Tax=unclassified Rhizobium TaxID=2613769 RepID=UPI0007297D14|nr:MULTISPECIES: retron system putative HNH endonuclease [unclassified Rhizobium]KRC06172.1 hypothetical protein ASE23_27205 [Rhizobium sp. Root73]
MKHSNKMLPPPEFVAWLGKECADWKPTYKGLSGTPMTAVRESLLAEQGHVCCYCGRPLKDGDGHIDHFWPQAHFDGVSGPDFTLNYNNFFRSCGPPGNHGVPKQRPSTCGDSKKNWYDNVASILPSDPGCEERFTFGQSGKIGAARSDDQAALNMIGALSLDDDALDLERAAIIAEVEEVLAAGRTAHEELLRVRARTDGKLPGFGHVVARYLELEFGIQPKSYR